MQYLSQAVQWVRTVLFGRRTPGKHARAHAAPAVPEVHQWVRRPSPQEWGLILQQARRRRAPHLWPPAAAPASAPAEQADIAVLVRPYVLRPEERRLALSWEVRR
jgi:hypothetical protein